VPFQIRKAGTTIPKILIADDNELARTILARILGQLGCTVCGQAANGKRAVEMALQLKPDMIILDIVMPELDGLSATSEILKTTPESPIVLYSFHANPHLEREGLRAGARRVISKGDPRSLARAVRELAFAA
jgi:DNA-binding NarL/FixJ family response regulator